MKNKFISKNIFTAVAFQQFKYQLSTQQIKYRCVINISKLNLIAENNKVTLSPSITYFVIMFSAV